MIATTEITLAHFVDDDMTVWHKVLAHAQSVHNRTPHPSLATSVTKAYSPAEIFLGRKLLSKLDADLQTEVRAEEYDLEAYASQLREITPGVREFVRLSQERYHQRMDRTARNM